MRAGRTDIATICVAAFVYELEVPAHARLLNHLLADDHFTFVHNAGRLILATISGVTARIKAVGR
ncbi:hypothetical protein D3C80_2200790 [compost metagenome]